MSGALAVFVKTPGFSPVKTRLAASIGQKKAEELFIKFTQNIENTILTTIADHNLDLVPYWAITEKAALNHKLWKNFKNIHSGYGDLGDRLCLIYNSLLEKHEYVIMIGADSPQISQKIIIETINHVKKNKCVIVPADDGGFYLFAGNKPIADYIWLNTKYSQPDTLKQITNKMQNIHLLENLLDVDDIESLNKLRKLYKFLNVI